MRILQFILFLILCAWLSSCRTCPPAKDIMNGKASQRHDQRKFRVIKMKAIGDGKYYVIAKRHFETRKEIFSCKPMVFNDSILLN